ncbi:MAG: hypothetical protein LBV07_03415 [Syntrophobacterales bacterium]|jgi:hypothetical protein|nr:hypothetical protein [Syntrophobacterales bacterium]
MKLIENEFLIKRSEFFDENDDLICPQNMMQYQIGLFDHLLSCEENEVSEFYETNSIDKDFSKYENYFLKFAIEIFENSDCPIFIDFDFENLSNFDIIRIISSLDYEDKYIWIEFVKKLDNTKSKKIKLETARELKMFFKIITREEKFPTFHFENGKVCLLGNFDLFFPIFFATPELVKKYRQIANKNNLHILEINRNK